MRRVQVLLGRRAPGAPVVAYACVCPSSSQTHRIAAIIPVSFFSDKDIISFPGS